MALNCCKKQRLIGNTIGCTWLQCTIPLDVYRFFKEIGSPVGCGCAHRGTGVGFQAHGGLKLLPQRKCRSRPCFRGRSIRWNSAGLYRNIWWMGAAMMSEPGMCNFRLYAVADVTVGAQPGVLHFLAETCGHATAAHKIQRRPLYLRSLSAGSRVINWRIHRTQTIFEMMFSENVSLQFGADKRDKLPAQSPGSAIVLKFCTTAGCPKNRHSLPLQAGGLGLNYPCDPGGTRLGSVTPCLICTGIAWLMRPHLWAASTPASLHFAEGRSWNFNDPS